MKVSTRILLAFVVCWVLPSCKQKTYTCCYNTYYDKPVRIGFIGFDSTELKTLVLKKYSNDHKFTQPYDSVIGINSSFIFNNDTAIENMNSAFLLSQKIDYSLEWQGSNTIHFFTTNDTSIVETCAWYDEMCRYSNTYPHYAIIRDLKINGNQVTTMMYRKHASIFINK